MVASFQGRRREQRGAIRRFKPPAYAATTCFARPWVPVLASEAAETDLESAGLVVVDRERVRAKDVPAKAMAVMEVALVAMD
jgi:hypothetical protein